VAGLWVVIGARLEQRRTPQEPAAPPEPAMPPTNSGRERLVNTELLAAPRRTTQRECSGVIRRVQAALRPLLFGLGAIFGWYALDRAGAVEAFAGFIGSPGTENASRIAFAFAALFWVGAALALVAPRGAALAFAGAGALGLVLACADRWEARIEWWGANAAASQWNGRWFWTGLAVALALLSFLAGWGHNRPKISRRVRCYPESGRAWRTLR
jgi:hypothetical protein